MRRLAYILAIVCVAQAARADAQGNTAHSPACEPVVVPLPTDGHANGITHHQFLALPPSSSEKWGHIEYPINVPFPTNPDGSPAATSFGLMWVMAQTEVREGFEWIRDGQRYALSTQMAANGTLTTSVVVIQPTQQYVVGRSGLAHVWVPGGIRYVWYPVMPNDAPVGVEPIESFRITIDHSDRYGPLSLPLSTVLHYRERVTLGVNMVFPYSEPIRTSVALHYRRC